MTQIDYFFGLGSPWAYIGLEPFVDLTRIHGARVVPHVIGLIEENGGIYSKNRPQVRRDYWFTDLKRWAHLRGVTLAFQGREKLSDFSGASDFLVAAIVKGDDWLALARRFHQAFWGEAQDIGDPQVRARLAQGFDVAGLEAFAKGPEVAAYKAASTELARKSGVFGLPSYLTDGQLFWGQDSLPFLDRHLKGEALTA